MFLLRQGKVTSRGIETPLGILGLQQLERGEVILKKLQKIVATTQQVRVTGLVVVGVAEVVCASRAGVKQAATRGINLKSCQESFIP